MERKKKKVGERWRKETGGSLKLRRVPSNGEVDFNNGIAGLTALLTAPFVVA